MNITSFDIKYLSQIIEIYNDHFSQDIITEEEFIRIHLCDMNFDEDLFLLMVDEDNVIGFLFGIKRKISYFSKGLQNDTAWIKLIATRNDKYNQGIGSQLMKEFEIRVKAKNGKKVILSMYSPNYFYSGVDINNKSAINFFYKNGYIGKEKSYWMECELTEYSLPLTVEERKKELYLDGFMFIPFEMKYSYSLLKMIKANFSEGWLSYVIDAIKNKRAHDEIIICVKEDDVVGYVSRASIDQQPGRFGPFGVSEDFRNHKLGEILIHEMFLSMKTRNINKVFFKSTEENGKRFYLRQGMEVKRIYQKFDKVIEN